MSDKIKPIFPGMIVSPADKGEKAYTEFCDAMQQAIYKAKLAGLQPVVIIGLLEVAAHGEKQALFPK